MTKRGVSSSSLPPPSGSSPSARGSGDGDATVSLSDADRSIDPQLEGDVGAMVGRYTLREGLGMGGMGVVFVAHDPQLDRLVAIKLLRRDRGRGSGRRAQMLSEAQAMAQLNHPNVIRVFDVGIVDDRAFIAMELIDGCTLAEWLATVRSWREILDVFMAAGHGLAAAHGAGLVHRDFKPHNVLVARDGGVRVLDFGLATEVGVASDSMVDAAGTSAPDLDNDETRDVIVVGTPAFMSPEQHLGLPLDTRSDQFGFCVALYGALYGQRAFEGETRAARLLSIRAGPPAAVRTGVPAAVFAVVRRGLAAEPAERWPTMDALLEALRRARTRSRRVVVLATSVAATIFAGSLVFAASHTEVESRCSLVDPHAMVAWDAPARERVHAALVATEATHAEATFALVDAEIVGYVDRWLAGHRAACDAADAEDHAGDLDARLDCLGDRIAALNALVEALASADAGLVDRAAETAAGLPPIDACADPTALARMAPQPDDPRQREAVAEIRHALAGANTLGDTGRLEEAVALADDALSRARALGFPAAIAEAAYASGSALRDKGELQSAEMLLEESANTAISIGHDRLLARAATELAVVLSRDGRYEESERWLRHADAAAGRDPADVGTAAIVHHTRGVVLFERGRYPEAYAQYEAALAIHEARGDELSAANTLNNIGTTRMQQGNYAEAAATFERLLPIMTSQLGAEHPRVALALANIAITYDARGQHERSVEFGLRALELRERVLGRAHADTGISHINLGLALYNLERDTEAKAHLEQALAILGTALGDDHVFVAASLNNLALVEARLGEAGRSLALHRRALEIRKRRLEPGHPEIATSLANVGLGLLELGDLAEARAHLEEALAINERALGPTHPEVALVHVDLGRLAEREGDPAVAQREFAAAVHAAETSLGPEHRDLVRALAGLGRSRTAQGRPADAIAPLERALRIGQAAEVSAKLLADTRFALAKALVADGGDRTRARALAIEARDAHVAANATASVAEVSAWLLAATR